MRHRLVAALLATSALLLVACGSEDKADSSAESTTSVAAAEPVSFAPRGPYSVGTIDLEVDPEHKLMVFYPLDAAPVDGVAFSYSGAELFGPDIVAALPRAFREPQGPEDAWVEAPASTKGPFPVVLYSHGASSYYRFSSMANAHLASYGYVVIAVDHPERGLLASFSPADRGASTELVSGTDQLFAALAVVEEQSTTAGAVLEGLVDPERLAGIGHSAGARSTGLAAYDDRLDAWIGEAPAAPVPDRAISGNYRDFDFTAWAADNAPPDVPSMIIAGDGDQVVPLDGVQSVFAWLHVPKRLVVLEGAGHNSFTDICKPIQEDGGLTAVVTALGIDPTTVPIVRLGEDGCLPGNIPAQQSWDAINHVTVAQLNEVFGIDAAVAEASLDQAWVQQQFPGAVESITSDS